MFLGRFFLLVGARAALRWLDVPVGRARLVGTFPPSLLRLPTCDEKEFPSLLLGVERYSHSLSASFLSGPSLHNGNAVWAQTYDSLVDLLCFTTAFHCVDFE